MKLKLENGRVLDTENSRCKYHEETDWDGSNHISRATGSQWDHQTLYGTRNSGYVLVHTSQWQGSQPSAEMISNEEAAAWLVLMGKDLPKDLVECAKAIEA